jgi:hypothetical protein
MLINQRMIISFTNLVLSVEKMHAENHTISYIQEFVRDNRRFL